MESKDKTIKQFISESASSAPFPGGGGLSALVAALAISLGNMVGSLTVGKKKYLEVQDEIIKLNEQCQKLEARCLTMIDEDAYNFEPLSKAYHLDKTQLDYDEIMEKALINACKTPLEIIALGSQGIDIIERYALIGTKLAISDAGCAASLLQASVTSASLNVYINTKYMKDRQKATKINEETNKKVNEIKYRCEKVFKEIEKALKGE